MKIRCSIYLKCVFFLVLAVSGCGKKADYGSLDISGEWELEWREDWDEDSETFLMWLTQTNSDITGIALDYHLIPADIKGRIHGNKVSLTVKPRYGIGFKPPEIVFHGKFGDDLCISGKYKSRLSKGKWQSFKRSSNKNPDVVGVKYSDKVKVYATSSEYNMLMSGSPTIEAEKGKWKEADKVGEDTYLISKEIKSLLINYEKARKGYYGGEKYIPGLLDKIELSLIENGYPWDLSNKDISPKWRSDKADNE